MLGPVVRCGETAEGQFLLDISPERAGWRYSGLRVFELAPGAGLDLATGADEVIVLPLSGGCTLACDGRRIEITGRRSVFDGPTDYVYLPRDAFAQIHSTGGGRFALPAARASRRLDVRYVPVEEVPVELRGAGTASRQVNNFCAPEAFPADRLIAVEVLTPGGNWSSYPPHKHDVQSEHESALEEIYYFEVDDTRSPGHGFGYQRVYSSGLDRRIDVSTEVRTGDAVLIPFGYHGPSMAAPGYDLYYLNVMAGPGERVWRFSDDPHHAWVRDSWRSLAVDPRLPLTPSGGIA